MNMDSLFEDLEAQFDAIQKHTIRPSQPRQVVRVATRSGRLELSDTYFCRDFIFGIVDKPRAVCAIALRAILLLETDGSVEQTSAISFAKWLRRLPVGTWLNVGLGQSQSIGRCEVVGSFLRVGKSFLPLQAIDIAFVQLVDN